MAKSQSEELSQDWDEEWEVGQTKSKEGERDQGRAIRVERYRYQGPEGEDADS